MRVSVSLVVFLALGLSSNAQAPASNVVLAQAQKSVQRDTSSEEIPDDFVPQNVPCAGQPRTLKELTALFQKGRFPRASQIKGTWVEIGLAYSDPSSPSPVLNCSGVKRGRKFDFVLVANGYSVELHGGGTAYPQTVTMQPDHKGSVRFLLDEGADEGPETYRCRLTQRGTLACLTGGLGQEFKKMRVQNEQVYDVPQKH